jgi:hypothetical protein
MGSTNIDRQRNNKPKIQDGKRTVQEK